MSTRTSLTRRQALLLSGSAAAGLVAAGLPRWAQADPSAGLPLPIPQLIEARASEPVVLTLQKTHHRFGSGPAVPSRGSQRATWVQSCACATAIRSPFASRTASMKRRLCIGMGCWCRLTLTADRTMRSNRVRYGRRRSRSSNPQAQTGSIRIRMGRQPRKSTRALPA